MSDTTEKQGPTCVGIIMDGNRRWAKQNGKKLYEGHVVGRETLKECIRWAHDLGIKYLVFYAFSTENWNRPKEEVQNLLDLFRESIENEFDEIRKENAKIRFVGQIDRFPEELQILMKQTEEETKDNTGGTIALCVSYGGRSEIAAGVNQLLAEGKQEISEEDIKNSFWSSDIPDPEIIIRTGGQKRLSNFLTWQSVYSELFFLDTMWPDLSREEFEGIINDYTERQRNFGT